MHAGRFGSSARRFPGRWGPVVKAQPAHRPVARGLAPFPQGAGGERKWWEVECLGSADVPQGPNLALNFPRVSLGCGH